MNLRLVAILSAACTMASVLTGALITGKHTGLVPIHAALGIILTLVGGLFAFAKRLGIRWSGMTVAVTGAVECIIGGQAPAIHAFIAPVVFTACVALVVFTSEGVKPDTSGGSSSLRALVLASPALVLVQIGLGAAYRHKLTGVLPHMAGAMLIAGFLLIVCAIVMQRFPAGAVRTAAVTLLSVVLLQVSLGIATFLMRLLDVESHPAFPILSVAHVCGGSLTLASSALLAIRYARLQRSVAEAPG